MARTINIASTATAGSGQSLTSTTYRLLAADGVTPISTSPPPYAGVSDGLLNVEQTVQQGDGQSDTVVYAIAGRVTDLAATSVTQPVLTWTDVGGESGYDVYRGTASDFVPDTATGTNRIASSLAANQTTYTDTTAPAGATCYYQVLAKNGAGATSASNVASAAVPAGITYEVADDFTGTAGVEPSARTPTWQGGAGAGAWERDPDDAALALLTGGGYLRGNTGGAIYRTTTNVAANGTVRYKILRKGTSSSYGVGLYLRWTPVDGGSTDTRLEFTYAPSPTLAWLMRKRVSGTFGVLSDNATNSGNIADTWPAGEVRIMEVVLGASRIDLKIYGNDGVTLVGSKFTLDTAVTGPGRLAISVGGSATDGFWADEVTRQAA